MAEFLSGEKLASEVEDIIFYAKKVLLIVSPFIKLDEYFKKAVFDKHKSNPDLHLIIIFGKNHKDPSRSLREKDFNYFKDFPNISIIYVENLHAKYYANEVKGIVTSINLYDYSFINNVEFGVVSETNFLGGSRIDKEAWEITKNIAEENFSIFIRRPIFKKKLFGKDYKGSNTLLDFTNDLLNGKKLKRVNVFKYEREGELTNNEFFKRISRDKFKEESNIPKENIKVTVKRNPKTKLVSATALGKEKGKSYRDVLEIMSKKKYVLNGEITNQGSEAGLKYRTNNSGGKWIVYPMSMSELLN